MTAAPVPSRLWQPVEVVCGCGRPHGGHRIELFEPDTDGRWAGESCGLLAVDAVEQGLPAPGLSPEDAAPASRLRFMDGTLPTWTGTCRHCREHARIRGERLVAILDALAARAMGRVELAAVRRLAARR